MQELKKLTTHKLWVTFSRSNWLCNEFCDRILSSWQFQPTREISFGFWTSHNPSRRLLNLVANKSTKSWPYSCWAYPKDILNSVIILNPVMMFITSSLGCSGKIKQVDQATFQLVQSNWVSWAEPGGESRKLVEKSFDLIRRELSKLQVNSS